MRQNYGRQTMSLRKRGIMIKQRSTTTDPQYERLSSTVSSEVELDQSLTFENRRHDEGAFTRNSDDDDTAGQALSVTLAFGLAGLLNNGPYVIMLASAKNISEGGVAAVYIANVLPSFCVKVSSPYWFDAVPYGTRLMVAASAMALAFTVTAYFSHTASHHDAMAANTVLFGQLSGVAMISFQCGLGEASLLALAGKWDSRIKQQRDMTVESDAKMSIGRCLTAFSSGTGLAGPLGYLRKIALTEWFGFSVSKTLITAAILMSISYGTVGRKLVAWSLVADEQAALERGESSPSGRVLFSYIEKPDEDLVLQELVVYNAETNDPGAQLGLSLSDDDEEVAVLVRDGAEPPPLVALADLTASERFHLVRTMCWPYMVPLFTVYAAEYACQAGAWTAIGFPVTEKAARSQFYEQANWLYQFGVWVSRSSGTLVTVNMTGLWIMPALQVVNLILFSVTATTGTAVPLGFLYQKPVLLSISFYTGLLGGAVYVHGYKRIVADVPAQYTEFALSSTSVAESLGIVMADISGLFLQSCLYRSNGLNGALVQCPF